MSERSQSASPDHHRWAVVGGGLLGLTQALRLAQAGRSVTVFEAAPEVGGLAGAWKIGGVEWDRHYHVTLESDLHLRGLLAELDLEHELVWRPAGSGLLHAGTIHPMNRPAELLRFPGLGLTDKFRLGATVLRAKRVPNPRALEEIGAIEWLRTLCGDAVVNTIWRPLLESKLGQDADRAAASFIRASIMRLHGGRRAGARPDRFGYVPGGYGRILIRLTARLRDLGVTIRTSSPIEAIDRDPAGDFRLGFGSSRHEHFQKVVVTVPSPVAARICTALPDSERAAHAAVRFQGILCASVLLKRSLSPHYVISLADRGLPFTGIIEMTTLVDPASFGGHSLVYLPRYTPASDPLFVADEAALRETMLAGLGRVFPALRRDDVVAFRVSRVPHVFAFPEIGYTRRLPSAATSVPGLFVINSAQIVDGTLNVNETVLCAERSAAWLLAGSVGASPHARRPEQDWTAVWANSRPHASGIVEREAKHLLDRALPMLNPRPDDTVLDIGCGTGAVSRGLLDRVAEVRGVDVSPEAIAVARIRTGGSGRAVFHSLDPNRAADLSTLGNRRYSLILAVSVLQYLPDVEALDELLESLTRHAAPGARLLVADFPNGEPSWRDAAHFAARCLRDQGWIGGAKALAAFVAADQTRAVRRLGISHLSASDVVGALRRRGLSVEHASEPLTAHRGRVDLIARFPAVSHEPAMRTEAILA